MYTPATIVPTLQADINLHVVTGATVKFSSVPADCLKEGLTLTRFEGPSTVEFGIVKTIHGCALLSPPPRVMTGGVLSPGPTLPLVTC